MSRWRMSWDSARLEDEGMTEEEGVVEMDGDGGWTADFGIEGDRTVPTERGRFKGGLRDEGVVVSNCE